MTTQTESEWEAEAMRLADRYRRAPLNDVSGYYQDLRAHLATRPQVPEGMVLVPREPTPEMLKAASNEGYSECGHTWHRACPSVEYRAMLAATGSKA